MNKLNPKNIADNFCTQTDKLLAYYRRAQIAFSASNENQGDISLLSEQVFLSVAVSFEGALSDLYFAYVNKDSSSFFASKEKKIVATITETCGQWYGARVAFPNVKHLKASELYPLLDPRGYNITFNNTRNMIAQAKKNLIAAHAAKYKLIRLSFVWCGLGVRPHGLMRPG